MGTVAQHFLAGAYTAGRATEHTAVYSPGSGEHLADRAARRPYSSSILQLWWQYLP